MLLKLLAVVVKESFDFRFNDIEHQSFLTREKLAVPTDARIKSNGKTRKI